MGFEFPRSSGRNSAVVVALRQQDMPTREQVNAELARRHFYDFVVQSWPVLHPTIEFTDGWHIGAIAEHLEAVTRGQIKNLLITVAPRHTKSVLASINWVPWAWIDNPQETFLYASFASHLASDHSVKARRLIESDWYQRQWGDRYQLTSDQNEKMKFENDKTGARTAFGMGGATGQGAKFVIVDDPHDIKDWTSPKKMQTAIETYESSIYNRANTPNDPRRVIIMQRISDRDLAGHVVKMGGWEHLMLPTQYDPARSSVTSIGWRDPRKESGEILCPARFNEEAALAEKKRRPRIYAAQYQQCPSTDEGAIFRRGAWQYYRDDPEGMVARMQFIIQSWDMAFKDSATSSKVAGQVWGRIDADFYLLARVSEHLDFVASIAAVQRMSAAWPEASAKVIEDKANGPAIINALTGKISGLISWPPSGTKMDSKTARAWAIQPFHEGGNIFLPHPTICDWTEEFVELCAAFPDGEFDDDIDCMTQALAYLSQSLGYAAPEGVGKTRGWRI